MTKLHSRSIFSQLFIAFLALSFLTLLICGWIFFRTQKEAYLDNTASLLHRQARLIAVLASELQNTSPASGIDMFAKSIGDKTGSRVTIIGIDGKVLGDSEAIPESMDNHADRPEVIQALREGRGRSVRYSDTLGRDFLYVAIPLKEGEETIGTLRVATPLQNIMEALGEQRQDILIAMLIVAIVAGISSLVMARYISTPLRKYREGVTRIGEGELSTRIYIDGPSEIEAVATATNQMAANLQEMLATVERQGQELKAMVRFMADGVMMINEAQEILLVNQRVCSMFAMDEPDLVGKPIYEVLRYADIIRLVENALTKQTSFEAEIEIPDLQNLHFLAHCVRLYAADGTPSGALFLLHDHTEEYTIRQNSMHFMENASQELGAPTHAIRQRVKALFDRDALSEQETRKGLRSIQKHADRIDSLLEDFDTLATLAKTYTLPDKRRIPLHNVLRNAAEYVLPISEAQGVEIQLTCAPDLVADVDVHLMSKALIHLLDNALRYSPRGATVQLLAYAEDSGICIRVQDEGEGISETHQRYVFDQFYRVEQNQTEHAGGTGLGLAIVQKVAKLHNGTATVQSQPGSGTSFIIQIKGTENH